MLRPEEMAFLNEQMRQEVKKNQLAYPIPQEYIPPLDRLILNGADGKQYALTVTDGAISVAPVTT